MVNNFDTEERLLRVVLVFALARSTSETFLVKDLGTVQKDPVWPTLEPNIFCDTQQTTPS